MVIPHHICICRLMHQAYLELAVLLLTNCGLLITQNRNKKESQTALVDSTANHEPTNVDSVLGDEVESGTDSPKPGRRSKKPKVKTTIDDNFGHKIFTSTEALNDQNSRFFMLNSLL